MPQSAQPWEGEHPAEIILRQLLNGSLASEATLRMEGHIAVCQQCRSRLDNMVGEGDVADTFLVELTQAFASNGFTSPVSRFSLTEQRRPDFETIAAYVDGTLARQKAEELEALMKQSPRLAQEVAELRALKEELRRGGTPEFGWTPESIPGETAPTVGRKERSALSPTRWAQWRWLVPSFGMATAMALLLFLAVKPWQRAIHKGQELVAPVPVKTGQATSTQLPQSNQETTNITRGSGSKDDSTPQKDAVQTRLLALSNPQSESQALLRSVTIRLDKVSAKFNSKRPDSSSQGFNERKSLALSQRWQVNVGDDIQFHFDNQAKQPLYLLLFWLAQDGSITPVTRPKPYDSFVIKLTPSGTLDSQISTIDYEIQPPTGLEKVKIFVSTHPLNAGYLSAMIKGASPTTRPASSLDVALGQIFPHYPPSKTSATIDDKSWATTTHEIYIGEK